MCEKDVGMGLCTFNFVFRLSLHLVCLLFGTSSLHLLNFFENFSSSPVGVLMEKIRPWARKLSGPK